MICLSPWTPHLLFFPVPTASHPKLHASLLFTPLTSVSTSFLLQAEFLRYLSQSQSPYLGFSSQPHQYFILQFSFLASSTLFLSIIYHQVPCPNLLPSLASPDQVWLIHFLHSGQKVASSSCFGTNRGIIEAKADTLHALSFCAWQCIGPEKLGAAIAGKALLSSGHPNTAFAQCRWSLQEA